MGRRATHETRVQVMLGVGKKTLPVTSFQARVAKLLSINRSSDSDLAGGAALHFEPHSIRFSQDLDYFHDSEIRVAEAYDADVQLLIKDEIKIPVELRQPGYIRVIAQHDNDVTKIEWAHDSAWRFMPTQWMEDRGFCLHPIDLAINKVLALAGRDESRDFLDVLHTHHNILELPGLIWAACGKDPGFSPHSLLELLQRKGKYQPIDFTRLKLNVEIHLQELKKDWLDALQRSRQVLGYLPTNEVGCLYYDSQAQRFVVPGEQRSEHIVPHFASECGILPKILE